jgi:hypothetical protein
VERNDGDTTWVSFAGSLVCFSSGIGIGGSAVDARDDLWVADLDEDVVDGSISFFQEPRTTGGPSSSEKSAFGRI